MSATAKRLQLAAEVRRLRDQGLTHAEVAKALGISRSYAATLDTDPDGVKQRARRDSYTGVCERCGGQTRSNGTSKPSRICATCAREEQHANKKWTPETVVAAIQRWAADHDGKPPRAIDWMAADPDNGYPAASSVYGNQQPGSVAPFAKWADAIEAAGFQRPAVGYYEPRRREICCAECGVNFVHRARGVVPRLCLDCRGEDVKAKKRAYRQRDDVKAKQRAYYQRDDVKAKQRAYYQERREAIRDGRVAAPSKWHCTECGEPLARQTDDGLCGFCRQGIPPDQSVTA